MKGKWVVMVVIFLALCMVVTLAFACGPIEDPPPDPPPENPPAEPAPQPAARPIEGTGATADQQMRELKGYVAPIENIENKLSGSEEIQIAPAPAAIEKTAPAAKEVPGAIEKLRALEDSSL